MPEEVIVSSSLRIGQTLPGTLKHFIGGREQRTPAPITLLFTLPIGVDVEGRQRSSPDRQQLDASIFWSRPEVRLPALVAKTETVVGGAAQRGADPPSPLDPRELVTQGPGGHIEIFGGQRIRERWDAEIFLFL